MKHNPRSYAKSLALIAVFTAMLVVCSWISVPFGAIPISLQTLALFCAFCVLGGWKGCAVVAVYLAMGAVGLPVFSGFGAGVGHLAGPTGGFLLGLLPAGAVYALACGKSNAPWRMVLGCVAALATLYTVGVVWYCAVTGLGASSLPTALLACVAPFVFPDLLKLTLAVLIALRVRKLSAR